MEIRDYIGKRRRGRRLPTGAKLLFFYLALGEYLFIPRENKAIVPSLMRAIRSALSRRRGDPLLRGIALGYIKRPEGIYLFKTRKPQE